MSGTIKEWLIVAVIVAVIIITIRKRFKIKDAMGEDNGRDKDNKERE